jgi:peptidoglycan/LPS O-acetylase OafA/YrhL
MIYRKDVQMLRGVAVLLVVLFHLELAGFSNGFLGVDVFFVISGYLMAVMYDEADKAKFFTRRASRLLPAYFATIICTAVASVAIITPSDFAHVAEQAWFGTFFLSNIGFWAENSYFDKQVFKPLLHLWSLGVEIQFYLLVPVLYWALKRIRAAGYVVLVLGSLGACFMMVALSPKTSFFWLPFRLWEFLFGFGVAKYLASASNPPRRPWLGAACLLLVILFPALAVIDGTVTHFVRGHPGLGALAAAAFTAVVLLLGLPEVIQRNPLATALERLGDWSYSIYLAHFPVITLLLYRPFAGTQLKVERLGQLLTAIALIAVASALLYRFVETPWRHTRIRPRWMAAPVAAVLLLTSAGVIVQRASIPAAEFAIYDGVTDRAHFRCGKLFRLLHPTEQSCELTPPMPSPAYRVMLVGNSHADSIKVAFAEVAAANNVSVVYGVDNAPLMGGLGPKALLDEAEKRRVSAIVLHFSNNAIDVKMVENFSRQAESRGVRVAYLMPVPTWQPEHVPYMVWASMKQGAPLPVQTLQDYERKNAALLGPVRQLRLSNFVAYSVADRLCDPQCHMTLADGRLLYFDAHHLTLTGANLLKPVFERVFNDLRGKGGAAIAPHLTPVTGGRY